ncbi:MAG TPA: helix-turn-helix domain-containing protein [Actinotalea sp.]|nr:helix-turn-helix domain-containing protein [Actinotalea sp.]
MTEPAPTSRSRRAAPLSPAERRASVLAAAVPLLLERGLDVSTRDLAEAAGVAEGTLFRVFPDKASLVRAAVGQALDPADIVARVAAAADPDLRTALVGAVEVILERGRTVSSLLAVVHQLPRDDGDRAALHGPRGHGPHAGGPPGGPHPAQAVVAALTDLLEPHAGRLRQPSAVCARLVVALALGVARPGAPELSLPADALVDLMLDGLLDPAARAPGVPVPPADPEPPC